MLIDPHLFKPCCRSKQRQQQQQEQQQEQQQQQQQPEEEDEEDEEDEDEEDEEEEEVEVEEGRAGVDVGGQKSFTEEKVKVPPPAFPEDTESVKLRQSLSPPPPTCGALVAEQGWWSHSQFLKWSWGAVILLFFCYFILILLSTYI